jgi:hypothetical protein
MMFVPQRVLWWLSQVVRKASIDDVNHPGSRLSCVSLVAALQVHVAADGNDTLRVNASSNVVDVLKALGNYGVFLQALQVGCVGGGGGRKLCVASVMLACSVVLCCFWPFQLDSSLAPVARYSLHQAG